MNDFTAPDETPGYLATDAPFRIALFDILGQSGVRDGDAIDNIDPGMHVDNLGSMVGVAPETAEQVAAIVSLCHEHRVPLVPHGGRTGLTGAGVTSADQLVLFSDRLGRIIEIDPSSATAIVEAGVTLQTLETAAREHGLSAGIDLGARGSATIGGMISTNAGGMEAFRNGTMRNRVLGLEAVLPDGSIMSDLSRVTKCNEGYDVKQLFCGAEGTLGVVTKAALRLVPATGDVQTLLVACPSADAALSVYRTMQATIAFDLVHAEIMWSSYAKRVAATIGLESVLSFCDANVYALFELTPRFVAEPDGETNEEKLSDLLSEALESGMVQDVVLAKNLRERDEIWRIREDSFVVSQTLPNGLWFDVSVPLSHLDAYAASVTARLADIDPALQSCALGHLGDGNLHYTVGTGEPLSNDMAEAVTEAVYEGLKAMGGSFSAEHGIGTSKRASLQKHVCPQKLRMMKAIKSAFDPLGIMNPGKVL